MRQITDRQLEIIDAVLAEKNVGGLTAAILEKDIHLTDVLHMLARIRFPLLKLVFCGGTSLSKAYQTIERMSEDIDLKMVLIQGNGLSRSAIKSMLSSVKKSVIDEMEKLGFVRDETGFLTRNENRYFATAWQYQSRYLSDESLRPHLSLELTLREPKFSTSIISVPYLVDQLAEIEGVTVQFECVSVEETLAEKVLSFLRRYAQHRSGNMKQDWDPALVRHIYDTYCIVTRGGDVVEKAKLQFKNLVQFDVKEFSQHQEFVQNPRECLLSALSRAEFDEQTINEYETRLLPLIHGVVRPNFSDAFAVFKRSSEALICTL